MGTSSKNKSIACTIWKPGDSVACTLTRMCVRVGRHFGFSCVGRNNFPSVAIIKECVKKTTDDEYAAKWRLFSKTRTPPYGQVSFTNNVHVDDIPNSIEDGGGSSSDFLTDDPDEVEATILEDLTKNVAALQSLYINRPAPSVTLEVSDVSSLIQT